MYICHCSFHAAYVIILYVIVLYVIVLYVIVLYVIVLYVIVLYVIVLYCTATVLLFNDCEIMYTPITIMPNKTTSGL